MQVLKHGFVKYVDHMGSDSDIVNTARTCYDNVKKSDDETLLRYLMRHRHTSPFESSRLKLHIKMPIFVARQWARHRTAGFNEISGRYAPLPNEYETIDVNEWRLQSASNKQGSEGMLPPFGESYCLSEMTNQMMDASFHCYEYQLLKGISRELARTVLPLATYTEMIWWCDLHNLLHLLSLRLDNHAQYEIRMYAEAVAEIVKQYWPLTWKAFVDYRMEAVTLTRLDIEALKLYMSENEWEQVFTNKRERQEFINKADKLGVKVL